jgi:hypothetical protein
VHPDPAERREREHRGPALRVGLDQQVATVAVAKGKLGDADHQVPLMLVDTVRQPGQRGLRVLTADGERLADHGDVPCPPILAVSSGEVVEPARDLGGLGRIGDEADLSSTHLEPVPTTIRGKTV